MIKNALLVSMNINALDREINEFTCDRCIFNIFSYDDDEEGLICREADARVNDRTIVFYFINSIDILKNL